MTHDPWISVRHGIGRIRGTTVLVDEVVVLFMQGLGFEAVAARLSVPYEAVDAAVRWRLRRLQRRRELYEADVRYRLARLRRCR